MPSYIFDVETNGLLRSKKDSPPMDRIHVLVMRDVDTRETFVFRRNDQEDTIEDGILMLHEADQIIGHNVVHFDVKAIQRVYPDWFPKGEVVDTLVLCRMIVPDIKSGDFNLNRKGQLPGWLIGSHSLDAWGYRLGKNKGDYAKEMAKAGLDPWAKWNQDMEDYCVNDVDVNELLYAAIRKDIPPDSAVALETQIHDIVGFMEDNGYFFDAAKAVELADHLRVKIESKSAEVVDSFGVWFKPKKKKIVKMQWDDPKGINRSKTYDTPDAEWGEDYSRAVWGVMTFPKVTWRGHKKYPDRTEGCPYVEIERMEFNPRSRNQIVDRFTTIYDWTPEDFTEKGSPSVDDAVLNKVIAEIPEAKALSEILFLEKRYGQVSKGRSSWLNTYSEETSRIHPYTNTGGTVSGRCSHASPNIAQVPGVMVGKDHKILLGDEGQYGYECRSLFYTPEAINGVPWTQVGVDLSGIEFRCLAERCAKYDDGELIEVVLSGDIHAINMKSTGITDRSLIKRVLYGLMYGAGDWKLGHTIEPHETDDEKRKIGRKVRHLLMKGLPAMKKVIEDCQEQAENGFLIGLDGRRLTARSPHAALNLRLQSDAAMIAKKWVCLTEDYAMEAGLNHGWNGDFSMLAFVHDELQTSVKEEYAQLYSELCVKAAQDAGKFFGFRCPVDAEAKSGPNWGVCH